MGIAANRNLSVEVSVFAAKRASNTETLPPRARATVPIAEVIVTSFKFSKLY